MSKLLYSPRGVFKGTREEWLEAAGDILGAKIDEQMNAKFDFGPQRRLNTSSNQMTLKGYLSSRYGFKPSSYTYKAQTIRYSCSLLGAGMTQSGALAHVHFKRSTGNNYDEIRMGVQVGGRRLKLDSARVADILLHEIIHTLCPHAGHRGPFRYIATHMGLKGKMTATVAGEDLAKWIKTNIVDVVGKYPHKAVRLKRRGQRGKGSRSIKCQCANEDCLFTMRTTRMWIERASFVLGCPICSAAPMIIQGIPTGGEEE
jgi:hypothetical protein